MAAPDLRMVVLAISPGYATKLREVLIFASNRAELLEDEHGGDFEKPIEAIIAEIADQLGSMPTAEEFAEGLRSRPGALPDDADEAGAVHIQTAAEKVADKMAKAALAAAEGTTDEHEPPAT